MHIFTDESLSWKTDEQGIFLTGARGSKMTSETKVEIEKCYKTLRIILWCLVIRKSIIKIYIKGGESKIVNKFEILHQKSKIWYQANKNSISVGTEYLNGDWIW